MLSLNLKKLTNDAYDNIWPSQGNAAIHNMSHSMKSNKVLSPEQKIYYETEQRAAFNLRVGIDSKIN